MKKFAFPLDRVLSWRHTQVRLAEVDLDRLRGELRALDQRCTDIAQAVDDAATELLGSAVTTAAELAALAHFRTASSAQTARLAQARAALEQRIQLQMQTVMERRREARLLERLRETRLATWRAGEAREIDQLAEESYLARLARGELRPS